MFKMIGAIVLAAPLLGVSACATTNSGASATNTSYATGSRAAVVAAASGDQEVECRRIRRIGQIIRSNVCMTSEEWARAAADSREAANSIEQNSVLGPLP